MATGDAGDAASGAIAGASIGTMIAPGIGTAVGAGLGGIGGYLFGGSDSGPSYSPDRANFELPGYGRMGHEYNSMLRQGGRSAPQAHVSGFRGDQAQLAQMLQNQARGNGPGQRIAQMQAEQQVDRGLGQQLASARSARPGQSAMAARNAAMASGQLQGQGAQAATLGGLQAQQQAVGSLGNVLAQGRGQDQALSMGNANLRYQTMGLDDRRQMELLRQRLQMNGMRQQGGIAYEGARQGQSNFEASQPSDWDRVLGAAQGFGQAYMQQNAGGSTSGGGGGGGGGGGYQLSSLPNPGSGYQNPVNPNASGQYDDENLYRTLMGA